MLLRDILDRVKLRFPRTDSELEAMLAEDIMGTLIPDVCRQFPYWFLEGGSLGGGGSLAAAFPFEESDLASWVFPYENWMDRGFLLLDAGIESYVVGDTYLPGDGDSDPNTWDSVLVNHLMTARVFDLKGGCKQYLEVARQEIYKDGAVYDKQARPLRVTWTDEYIGGVKKSVFKFNPVPDKHYIVQLDWNVCVPATIPRGSSEFEVTNILIETYPEVAINLGMLAAAEYFNEARLVQYYERKLWGTPAKASPRSASETEGLIGRMKHDTRIRKRERHPSLPFSRGSRRPPQYPRDGYSRRGRY